MINEIIMAIIQSITEFLPISSDGHLALYSNLFSEPNLFFITFLHLASLFAVIIYTRKELYGLILFKKQYRKLYIYLIIATIPAALIGFFFNDFFEKAFSSLLITSLGFFFTGTILLLTKLPLLKNKNIKEINYKNSIYIGIMQSLALLPGVSRSGLTISTAMYNKIDKEKAAKFSFLLFIPLAIGAFGLEFFDLIQNNISINIPSQTLAISFFVCFLLSLACLNLLTYIIKKDKFYLFSIYCYLIGLLTLILYFLK